MNFWEYYYTGNNALSTPSRRGDLALQVGKRNIRIKGIVPITVDLLAEFPLYIQHA